MPVTRLYDVELACLLCGCSRAVKVDRLEQLRPTPCPVTGCGGRLFVSGTTAVYHYGDPADLDFDWDAGRPRRGRPLRKVPVRV